MSKPWSYLHTRRQIQILVLSEGTKRSLTDLIATHTEIRYDICFLSGGAPRLSGMFHAGAGPRIDERGARFLNTAWVFLLSPQKPKCAKESAVMVL